MLHWLLPTQASDVAPKIDGVIALIFWVCVAFFVSITTVMVYFIIRYRKRPGEGPTAYITGNALLEAFWIVLPGLLLLGIFAYGFSTFKDIRTPKDGLEINVTGRQWLWQFRYPNGRTSVNELRLPINEPVKLVMRSDDVIHDFYVPEFRLKQDMLPNRYTYMWFTPTKTGTYDILCAEYCGTGHSSMLGKLVVLEKAAYEDWQKASLTKPEGQDPIELGRRLFTSRGCNACHTLTGQPSVGPTLKGAYGHEVTLQDGRTTQADENYLLESILEPKQKVVKGFQPVMPPYAGMLSQDEAEALVDFIKTLK